MKKNNKGFTLIELMAVVIILIIVIFIAITRVNESSRRARNEAIRANAATYIKAVNNYVAVESVDNDVFENISLTLPMVKNQVKVSGTIPDSANFTIVDSEISTACLEYNGFKITYNSGNLSDVATGTCDNGTSVAYSGSEYLYVAPLSGSYKIELWGAQGGSTSDAPGGKGAYVSGVIELNRYDKLYIYVGGKGDRKLSSDGTGSIAGGYNGGANGYKDRTDCSQQNASGGGATDVRLVGGTWNAASSLNSRIMVAAGGGGSFQEYCGTGDNAIISGGAGGALSGETGTYVGSYAGFSSVNPLGATQTSGGQSLDDWNSSSYTTTYPGQFGYGATGARSYGGGGGGYYGGASGQWQPGAGGSSYISGYTGCVAITSNSSTDPKTGCADDTVDNACSVHYSSKVFTGGIMISGNNEMPTHDGSSTMVGNADNGYAKITFVE